jgi:hypothetical protein
MNTAIRNAMPEERLAAAAGDPAKSSWSSIETLLAMLVDEMRQLEWMYAQTHSDEPVKRPSPIRRPGTGRRKLHAIPLEVAQRIDPRLRGMSAAEAQEFLSSMTGVN